MSLNQLVLLLAFVTLILSDGTNADFDCKAPPNFRMSMNCCRIIQPNISQFPACEKYTNTVSRKTFSCTSSCVFNSTEALDKDGKLILPNLRNALLRLLPVDETNLDNIVLPIFKECETEAERIKMNAQNVSRLNRFESECPTLPLMYFMCAGDKIFMQCPDQYWTSSAECTAIKDYVAQCGRHFGDRGRRPWRGGRRSRL